MHHGRKSHIITAYSALATVAIGLVAFDFVRRSESGPRLVDQPAQRVFAMVSPPAPKAKSVTASRPNQPITVASYTARRPRL